jgi:predicted nucleotidyltransferase
MQLPALFLYLFKRRLCIYKMNRFADRRDKILPVPRPYVSRIAVFGSFARGEETPEMRPKLGLGWFGLEEELSRIMGREVELIAEGSLSPYLRPYAERHILDSIRHLAFSLPAQITNGCIRPVDVS